MDKTIVSGIMENGVVKTSLKGSIEDCVDVIYEILSYMSVKQNKTIKDVMFDIFSIDGEKDAKNITYAHLIANMDSGEIFSKDLSQTQTFALMCALGIREDMNVMNDKEVEILLGDKK